MWRETEGKRRRKKQDEDDDDVTGNRPQRGDLLACCLSFTALQGADNPLFSSIFSFLFTT